MFLRILFWTYSKGLFRDYDSDGVFSRLYPSFLFLSKSKVPEKHQEAPVGPSLRFSLVVPGSSALSNDFMADLQTLKMTLTVLPRAIFVLAIRGEPFELGGENTVAKRFFAQSIVVHHVRIESESNSNCIQAFGASNLANYLSLFVNKLFNFGKGPKETWIHKRLKLFDHSEALFPGLG